jgi:hypothetical protein
LLVVAALEGGHELHGGCVWVMEFIRGWGGMSLMFVVMLHVS